MAVFTLEKIAEVIGGELNGKAEREITAVMDIDRAGENHITFLANPKYSARLADSRAAAVIIDRKIKTPPKIDYIRVPDAYFGFRQALILFNPPRRLIADGIHESAVIDASATVGEGCAIGANVYLGPGVRVGNNTQILPNCVLLNNVSVGDDCLLYPLVSVREDCRIGNRVIIHNGAVIGSDGFGFAPYQGKSHKIPQLGCVIIEDDVEIGANVTIDRATMGETVIKQGVKLDNLVQIAHNVTLGEHTVMAAQSGISGSTEVGKYVQIGGQVGVVGHIRVGDFAQIAAKTGVARTVPEKEVLFGSVGRPIQKAKRIEAVIGNLPEMSRRLRQLEKTIAALQPETAQDAEENDPQD